MSSGKRANRSTKVAYSFSALPLLWQLAAHIVWPGVSMHSSSSVLPTLTTSPALTPQSTPAMHETDSWCTITFRSRSLP